MAFVTTRSAAFGLSGKPRNADPPVAPLPAQAAVDGSAGVLAERVFRGGSRWPSGGAEPAVAGWAMARS